MNEHKEMATRAADAERAGELLREAFDDLERRDKTAVPITNIEELRAFEMDRIMSVINGPLSGRLLTQQDKDVLQGEYAALTDRDPVTEAWLAKLLTKLPQRG